MHHTNHTLMGFKTVKATCGKRVPVSQVNSKVTCPTCRAALQATIDQNERVRLRLSALPINLQDDMRALIDKQSSEFLAILKG